MSCHLQPSESCNMIRRIEVEFHPSQTSDPLLPSCYETPPRSHNSDLLLLNSTTLVGKIEIVRHKRQVTENAGISEKGNTENKTIALSLQSPSVAIDESQRCKS